MWRCFKRQSNANFLSPLHHEKSASTSARLRCRASAQLGIDRQGGAKLHSVTFSEPPPTTTVLTEWPAPLSEDPMAATMCVQCSSLGFVAEERVTDGITIVVKYRCDRCNFSWQASGGETPPDPNAFAPTGPTPGHRNAKSKP